MPPKKLPGKQFRASQAAEQAFAMALKRVGRVSGHMVEAHVDGHTIKNSPEMIKALLAYSKLIEPWARRQSAKMLFKVSQKSKAAFTKQSKLIGKLMQSSVAEADVGRAAEEMMKEQVLLIQSIPVKAAERAQKLALEAAYSGARASEVAEELARSGKVSESDAIRIARTETARANASINQTRAQSVGSKSYRWRNAEDESVRHAHKFYKGKRLDGRVFLWSQPPTLEDGTTGHPGTFPNCRCYAEPVFDDSED